MDLSFGQGQGEATIWQWREASCRLMKALAWMIQDLSGQRTSQPLPGQDQTRDRGKNVP